MKKWKVWLVIVTVFVSGLVIGSVGTRSYVKHRVGGILHGGTAEVGKKIMNRLTTELDLTEQQTKEVGKIVEETQHKLQQLRAQYRPQMEQIINTGMANVKTKISPEQQKKLDGLYEKVKKRWDMRRGMGRGMKHGAE